MPFGNRKKYFRGSYQFSIVFKKYHPSGNLKCINSGISQSLKLRILMEKILSISLKLNFTPNTLGCFGLSPMYSMFARSPLSVPQTPFFRSFRSTICNPERSHWMGMPRITNGGPERARKRTLGQREGRSCKRRIG